MSKRIVLLQALGSTPTDVARLTKNVDAAAARRRPAPEMWSVADVVNHLIYVEELYRARFRRIAQEDRPFLPYIHPNEAAHNLDKPLAALVEQFRTERAETLEYLGELSLGDWQRPAVHETLGETRFRFLVQYLLDHDTEHLNQLIETRRQLDLKPSSEAQPAIPVAQGSGGAEGQGSGGAGVRLSANRITLCS